MPQIVPIPSEPMGMGGGAPSVEHFVATAAQAFFDLSASPSAPEATTMTVDTVEQEYGPDFNIVGARLFWQNSPVLKAGQRIVISYF